MIPLQPSLVSPTVASAKSLPPLGRKALRRSPTATHPNLTPSHPPNILKLSAFERLENHTLETRFCGAHDYARTMPNHDALNIGLLLTRLHYSKHFETRSGKFL